MLQLKQYLETHKEAYDNKIFYTDRSMKKRTFLSMYKDKGIRSD